MSHSSLEPGSSRPIALDLLLVLLVLGGPAASAGTVTWIHDGDGLWAEGANWDTGLPPGPADDVVIDRESGLYTVTVSGGSQFAGSIACAENLTITGGTLTVATTVQVDGVFAQTGGTLIGATVESALVCTGAACVLQGVTLAADLIVGDGANTAVTVVAGLVLDGTAYLGQGAYYGNLSFSGSQSLVGTGSVVFSDNGSNTLRGVAGVLTIGPGILVHGTRGRIQGPYGLVIQGAVRSDVPGGLITIDGAGWRNDGLVEATGGAGLSLDGEVATADLGDIRGTDGTVELDGLLDNTGQVLALDAVTGSWVLDTGTILGGVVDPGSGGAGIVYQGGAGRLDGVTMDADMIVGEVNSTAVTILNGLTLNGTAHLGWGTNYGRLNFVGTQALDGSGEVVFSGNGSNALSVQSGSLTIGPGIRVHGVQGRLLGPSGFLNLGVISADEPGGLITLDGDGWRNEGVIEAAAGGTLRLSGRVATADLGDLRGSGGVVELAGTLDNTGDSLLLDAATGSLALTSGTILGGVVEPGTGGARVVYRGLYGRLDGVTMNADMIVGELISTYVTVLNGLTLNGTAYLGWGGNYGRLTVNGNQTLDGSGQIVFSDNAGNAIAAGTGVLTIGRGLLVRGVRGRFLGSAEFVNQGSIHADVPAGVFTLEGAAWSNQGSLQADGATLACNSPVTSTGRVRVGRGGLLDTDEIFTQTGGATVVDSGGVLHSDLTVDIRGGCLSGHGGTEGLVVNGGCVGPGGSAGTLVHTGDFHQTAAGTLRVELGGVEHGLHDRLLVSGAALLDGVLDVDWIYNFSPAAGDTFVILESASRTGTFATEDVPDLPPGLDLIVDYRPGSVVLRAVGSELFATIQAVTDVPADQGGFVQVSWYASTLDDPALPDPVTAYDVQKFGTTWEPIGSVPATGAAQYAAVVATTDVLIVGEPAPWGYYRVLARTGTPGVFYSSPSDSGYSIDNLPPPPPVLVLAEDLESRVLTWSNPDVPDLGHTCLYRIDVFGGSPDSLMVCSVDTSWTESHRFYYDYYCRAADVHGNVGEASNLVVHVYPSDVNEAPPGSPYLAQNNPNPFNARTTIACRLPAGQAASLRVYDLRGRLVATLLEGAVTAPGRRELVWDGRDGAGRAVAAGGYFCRLEAGGYGETRRMVLVK